MLQSIGIGASVAVVPLWSWHCYLMGSAQTTIEYFGNAAPGEEDARSGRQRETTGNHHNIISGAPLTQCVVRVLAGEALRKGEKMCRSPYSLGPRLNWQAVFGSGNPVIARKFLNAIPTKT